MQIQNVAINRNGALQSAVRQWQLISPVTVPPLQVFQKVVYLRFVTDGVADQISIDEEATTLRAVFQPYDYDAITQSEPTLRALRTSSEGAVIVTLDAPRQVRQVSYPSYLLELYRLDGNKLADNPTVSVSNATTLSEDFTDRRFAIRLKKPDGQHEPLSPGDILELRLRSYPTGPRLGIAKPGALSSGVFFWQAPGEIGKTASMSQGEVNAGTALVKELQRYLDGLSALHSPLPQCVDIALVIESDAPCTLNITAFYIMYHLVSKSFFPYKEKQVLRFPGNQVTAQKISVKLSGNAIVTSATLQTVESFRSDRPLSSNNGDSLPSMALAQKEGIYIGGEKWVAQSITPQQAISVSGIVLGLMSVADKTELAIELHEDWHGQPSGKKLVETMRILGQLGKRNWVTLRFPESIVIPSQPHWILIKATSGCAVWLVKPGNSPVRVLEKSCQKNLWTELSIFDGLQAIYRLCSQSNEVQQETPPITLHVGTQAVTSTNRQNDIQEFDLTFALNNHLDTQTVDNTIPLTFTAIVPGIMTVYPPYIKYDISDLE
ncbi:hypothetical protein U27_05599 [Candidatus Vecturithrix granuli]|uniref:Uncharacterized protein n=1 Tax=Vecturithrix granuli TaxID=1499967 RepID=A0A081C220_VECG1|nr:hypothetical protein U27_05599 [Candidatus Vecturithrix granuli]